MSRIQLAIVKSFQVDLLQLPYPMPLIGLVNFVMGFVAEVAVLYLTIPRAWRQNPAFFRIILWLVATQLFLIVVFLFYFLLGFGFYIIPSDYQWTLALLIPLGNTSKYENSLSWANITWNN